MSESRSWVGAFAQSFVVRKINAHCWLIVAFFALALVYFCGIAAEVFVGFGPPRSIISVFKQIKLSDLLHPQARLPFHLGVFVVSFAAVVIYTLTDSRRKRLLLSLLYMFSPLLFFLFCAPVLEAVIGWGYLAVFAPVWTANAIAGRQDGEFYAEGFLAATAVGWWVLIWLLLIVREAYLRLSHEPLRRSCK